MENYNIKNISNSNSNSNSKLYLRARINKDTERQKLINKNIIKHNLNLPSKIEEAPKDKIIILPEINQNKIKEILVDNMKYKKQNSTQCSNTQATITSKYTINKKNSHALSTTNITKPLNKVRLLKPKMKNYRDYFKDIVLKMIQIYLDPLSVKNFILTCKKFKCSVENNDELWYYYYIKKFKTKIKYEENRGKWKNVFLNTNKSIFKTNYDSLKLKFIQKFNKNIYQAKKDPYFISNHLYSFLKPIYTFEIDGKIYKMKHIFSNKILSHINFFANFDQDYIDLNKIKKLKLLLSEKNLGIFDMKIIEYDIKKIKFYDTQKDGIESKICKIYYNDELILSTFEANLIFFLSISYPICKICEYMFDFMNGMHGKNLNYFDDSESKFGLYDYTLLINLKSWKNVFYTFNVNTLDFKQDNDGNLTYKNDGKSK
jgi:hypothetical protein